MVSNYAMPRLLAALLVAMTLTSCVFAGEESRQQQLVSELFAAIDQADEMIIYSDGFKRDGVIYWSSNRRDFEQLKSAITLKHNGGPFVRACMDGPEIALLKKNKEIASVWNHEGTAIGSSVWKGDWQTNDPDRWLKWFDARGMKYARELFNDTQDRQRKREIDEARWLSTMPSSLQPLWPAALKQYEPLVKFPDLKPLNTALAAQFPDQQGRIRALMAWYGSGAGPWSGFPAYEQIAEKLLRQYPTTELIESIEARNLTDKELEGAARILGGWTAVPDTTPIPLDLRQVLLEHCLKSSDQDKIDRAKKAFSSDSRPADGSHIERSQDQQ